MFRWFVSLDLGFVCIPVGAGTSLMTWVRSHTHMVWENWYLKFVFGLGVQLPPHHTHEQNQYCGFCCGYVCVCVSIVINFKTVLDFKEIYVSVMFCFLLEVSIFANSVWESVLLSIEFNLIQVWRRQCLLSVHPIVDEKLQMHQVGVGELAPRSRALAALLEVMSSIPIKHIVAHNHL